MLKEVRQKKLRLRRNFLPTFLLIIGFWIALASIIFYVDPARKGALILFFVTFFCALLFTMATLFLNTRRGFIASLTITVFLLMKYVGIGSILHLVLLLAVAATAEYYFWSNKNP